MSSEVDLVVTYMNGDNVSPDELPIAWSILEDAIAVEVERGRRGDMPTSPRRTDRRTRRLARWSVVATLAAAAIAVLILQVVPTSNDTTSEAAGAVISRLAADAQTVPPLLHGQWYQYQLRGVLSAEVSSVGKTPTPNAKASIPFSLGSWSNSTSVCNSQQFGTATFASPTNAQAWQAIGLLATPANQPDTGCAARVVASTETGGSSLATTDVSNITHDPETFAEQLQKGTTGIQSSEQYPLQGDPANVAAFIRLTNLLVGPTTGQWSGFGQEMLKTMALLPGVTSLGEMTSHSGAVGLAFTSRATTPRDTRWLTYEAPPTVILDPPSGTLLEGAATWHSQGWTNRRPKISSAALLPLNFTQGVTYGATAQWIDPVAPLSVTPQDALPGWIGNIHIIKAVTKRSVAEWQATALLASQPFAGDSGFTDENTPGPGRTTIYLTVTGAAAYETAISRLRASELFASISGMV